MAAIAAMATGCVSPNAGKAPEIYWTTIEPAAINPTAQVLAAGPFHLRHFRSICVMNLDENYKGDDTPWLDRTDDFRQKIADSMYGYDPAAITLADMAVARVGFLEERLGTDFVWKEEVDGGKYLGFFVGRKFESIDKYAYIRTMYADSGLFKEYSEKAKRKMTIEAVEDFYRIFPGKAPGVRDVSVYLYGFRDSKSQPVPKATFTMVPDELVRQIAVEGTERQVPDGTAIDIETPRGRFTVYRPSFIDSFTSYQRNYWLPKQKAWYVGKALVKLLNELPEEELLSLKGAEE